MKIPAATSLIAVALLASAAQASMTVNTKYCDVFQEPVFKGEWMRLQAGKSLNLKNNRKWNDRISSLTVGQGCVAEIWLDADFKGRSLVVQAGRHPNLKAWNNGITSLTCTCDVKG